MDRKSIDIPQDKLADFCRRHHIRKLSLFGSALRDDFGPESDVDLLAEFDPEAHFGLFALVEMERELKDILGRDVDLVDRRSVERSENYIRRKRILSSLETLYVAG